MELSIYQVDAFSGRLFSGNPAAVVPLDAWLDDASLQAIAAENNLSETAFFVPSKPGFELRWFTPECEVSLCGHATLASAWVIFNRLGHSADSIAFSTRSGTLIVSQTQAGLLEMNFPARPLASNKLSEADTEVLKRALGCEPLTLLCGEDALVQLASQTEVEQISPDFSALKRLPVRGVIVTAAGDEVDFVSRFFAPNVGINEDPVTGSAHTLLTPFWVKKTGHNQLRARQLSARGGDLECELMADRVLLRGQAVPYLTGTIELPDEPGTST